MRGKLNRKYFYLRSHLDEKLSSIVKSIYAFNLHTRDIIQCEINELKPVTKSIHLEKWGNGPVLPRAKFIRI